MAKKKSKKNNINFKKLFYFIIGLLLIIFLIWYIISWKNVKKEEKLMNSYLITSNTLSVEIKDLSETIQVLKESPSEYFVYISYTIDEKVYSFENYQEAIDKAFEISSKDDVISAFGSLYFVGEIRKLLGVSDY